MTARPLVTHALEKQTTPTNEAIVHRPSLSMVCAGCDGDMVITKDAIGRERLRCPTCHGVSKIRPHRDDAQLPQGLVHAHPMRAATAIRTVTEIVVQLPPITPGQLRCQRCAGGVDGNVRFCGACQEQKDRARKREARGRTRVPLTRQCLGCGRVSSRANGPKTTHVCTVCRPTGTNRARIYQPKLCARCRARFQPGGPRSLFCEACR